MTHGPVLVRSPGVGDRWCNLLLQYIFFLILRTLNSKNCSEKHIAEVLRVYTSRVHPPIHNIQWNQIVNRCNETSKPFIQLHIAQFLCSLLCARRKRTQHMYHIQIHISKQRCHVDLCTVCVAAGSDTVILPNNIESNLTLTACFVDCIISAKAKKLHKDSLLSRKFSCVED